MAKNQIFNKKLLEEACQDFGFFNHIKLLFRPTNYSFDGECKIWFKELEGKIFIMKVAIE